MKFRNVVTMGVKTTNHAGKGVWPSATAMPSTTNPRYMGVVARRMTSMMLPETSS